MRVIAADLAPLAAPIDKLDLLPGNPRRGDVEAIARSLAAFGQRKPVVARRDGAVIAGNHTLLAARSLGWDELAVVWVDDDPTTAHAYALADNRTAELGGYDDAALAALIAEVQDADAELLAATGWDDDDLKALIASIAEAAHEPSGISLAERFGVPPFSVLDARQGYWRERKQHWLEFGIASGLGRDAGAYVKHSGLGNPVSQKVQAVSGGLSIFDPVLCELAYRWFAPPGGSVLDPFAGGSVRGVVAAAMGHPYIGIDLSIEQLDANRAQWPGIAARLGPDAPAPDWSHGDSREVVPTLATEFDFLFSCPPYADLEKYTDDPRDISNLDYDEFLDAYSEIIAASVAALRPERFAVFVVGDLRGPRGFYRNFPADTIRCFHDAGAALYNEAVLVTAIATASLRAGGQFEKARKLCKVHQNVLVFYKGDDPRRAVEAIGPVSFAPPDDSEAD